MNEKLLFESKGGNKTRELIQIILGIFLMAIGLFLLFGLLGDKGGMSHSGYGGTWAYREAPGLEEWLIVIVCIILGLSDFISGLASKSSYLKIFEKHIEAKSFNIFRLLIGGNGSVQSNISLNYNEIQGVSIQKNMIVVDTYGKHVNIFCSNCIVAEKILVEQLNKHKSN